MVHLLYWIAPSGCPADFPSNFCYFPGGLVVKTLHSQCTDTGAIPGQVRSHMMHGTDKKKKTNCFPSQFPKWNSPTSLWNLLLQHCSNSVHWATPGTDPRNLGAILDCFPVPFLMFNQCQGSVGSIHSLKLTKKCMENISIRYAS